MKNTTKTTGTKGLTDETNPAFTFNGTHNELLARLATGELDAKAIAREQMASRGLNDKGTWIGFEEAKKFWAGK